MLLWYEQNVHGRRRMNVLEPSTSSSSYTFVDGISPRTILQKMQSLSVLMMRFGIYLDLVSLRAGVSPTPT